MAPNGSVEWFCLPRPDSPSIFGAILDRTAGNFRFGPTSTQVPHHRRYIPGTMALETTWHTPSGWLVVAGPARRPVHGGRPAPDRLSPRARRRRAEWRAPARRHLHRGPCRGHREPRAGFRVRQADGPVVLRGGRLRDHVRVPAGGRPVADPSLVLRSRGGRRPLLRAHHSRQGRVRVRRALVVGPPSRRSGRGAGTARCHRDLLAGLALQRHLPRPPVAHLHGAQRPHPQGPQLRADRGHHGGRHDLAARDARRRSQLGLPLHVDPRLVLHVALALPPRVRVGGHGVLRLRHRGRGGRRRQELGAPDHVRHRRPQGPHRGDPRPPVGMAELTARPRGQRRVEPAPERRVGHAARRSGHPPAPGSFPDRAPGLGRPGPPRRHGDRTLRRSRPGHLGDPG